MNRRWILGVVALLVVAGAITAAAIWGPDGDWNDRHDRVEVVRVVNEDGTTTGDGDTLIIERDRGFFPFGLFFFPLGVLFLFLVLRFIFWGPRGGGPWRGEPSAQWLDEWHRRQHAGSGTPPGTPADQ